MSNVIRTILGCLGALLRFTNRVPGIGDPLPPVEKQEVVVRPKRRKPSKIT